MASMFQGFSTAFNSVSRGSGSSGDAAGTTTTIGSKIQALKRAGQQQIALMKGHAPTSDIRADRAIATFREKSEELTGLEKELRAMIDSWKIFDAAKQQCACVQKHSPKAFAAMSEKKTSAAMADVFQERVFGLLASARGHVAGLDDLVKKRQALLIDHDHHLRVHKSAELKVSAALGDAAKHAAAERHLVERTEKLSQAQQALSSITESLLYKLLIYDRAHDEIITNISDMVGSAFAFDARQALVRAGSDVVPDAASIEQFTNDILEAKLNPSPSRPPPDGAAADLRRVLEDCEASMQKDEQMKQFGRSIEEFDPAMSIMTQTIAFLESPGPTGEIRISTEGIFRISGDSELVGKLRDQVERGCQLDDACFLLGASVNEVADLLKMFLRELPTPLVPMHFSETTTMLDDMASGGGREIFVDSARSAAASLLPKNQVAICLLMNLLSRVSHRSAANLMTANNLAVCLTPTIFGDGAGLEVVTTNIKLFESLIDCAESIWGDELSRFYPAVSAAEMSV